MIFSSIHKAAVVLVVSLAARQALGQADVPAPTPPISAEVEADARVALAERFYDLGLFYAHATQASKATLKESEIFLHAASQMDPFEPRYLRMLAQVAESEGDADLAIAAWKNYLRIPDLADDHVAQVELIELYLGKMQNADDKLSYLKMLLANPKLNKFVKARLAVTAARLLDQRARPDAVQMLAEARGYYPLPEVTILEWEWLASESGPEKRFEALLNILRANPLNADAIARAADILSEAGLSEDALGWYKIMMDVHAAQQTGPAAQSLVNYLGERYRAGETTVASDELEKVLSVDPNGADFWFLRLVVQRADESADILGQGEQAFLRRLNVLCGRIVPEQADTAVVLPTTRPSAANPSVESAAGQIATQPTTQQATTEPSGLPRVIAAKIPVGIAIQKVKEADNAELKNALSSALADVAWFEVYFNHKPEQATPWLNALKDLVPADNAVLKRLVAWQDLASNRNDAARAVFTAQQDADPLSALGLFALEDRQLHRETERDALGVKILSTPHTGVLGALLWQATRGRGYKSTPPPEQAAIQTQLAGFPRNWLETVHSPFKMYVLRADPVKVGHKLGEPFLATVTLQNVSKLDLTIGNFGLLQPLLVFDGELRGQDAHSFPGIAIDRIMGRFVLQPGEVISQTIRLDEGELGALLRVRPEIMLLVNATVVSNARRTPNSVIAMAGGYARNFSKMFTRVPQPLTGPADDTARRNLIKQLTTGTPSERLLDIDLLAAYIVRDSVPTATVRERSFAQQFADVIDKAITDPTPGSKIWASYMEAMLFVGPGEQKAIDAMLASNSWESRLLALHAVRLLPASDQAPIFKKYANEDKDLLVKDFAIASLELLDAALANQISTTQPSTQPADGSLPPAASSATPPAVTAPLSTQTPSAVLAPATRQSTEQNK